MPLTAGKLDNGEMTGGEEGTTRLTTTPRVQRYQNPKLYRALTRLTPSMAARRRLTAVL
jgi:hypothetical protein